MIRLYRMRRLFSAAYGALARLQKSFFDSYFEQDNLAKHYQLLHKRQIDFFKSCQRVTRILKKHSDFQCELNKIEAMHNIICSLHLLRFRCNDFSVFEICAEEMRTLQVTLTMLLLNMAKEGDQQHSVKMYADRFLSAIGAFESIGAHTLCLVASDPEIFEFFIQDLYALYYLTVDPS